MKSDTYLTIESSSEGLYKEKGSRFIAYAFPVSDEEEIKNLIKDILKKDHSARHHCSAYMLGYDRMIWRTNDDGEPSGTAGRPILGQINHFNLTNILIVVSRYFGGTLLGVGGLINAYRSAAADAIHNARVIRRTLQNYYEITYPYEVMNDIMKVLKEEKIIRSDEKYDNECSGRVNFRKSQSKRIEERLSRIEGVNLRYIETR